ncbi:hypothetical protein [Nonomuraea sp. NPDC048901]|uniref:hypothetical protein n=1 Tax=Nonomuraea sp. NPDC048901 TaxID=3155627 RepID=UPI003402CC3A
MCQPVPRPYDKQAEGLFDGNHQAAGIVKALPPTSEKLFAAEFLDKVRRPALPRRDADPHRRGRRGP